MISIPRPLLPGWARRERTGGLLPGGGSIISPSTGASLTRSGGQWAYYSFGCLKEHPHVCCKIIKITLSKWLKNS